MPASKDSLFYNVETDSQDSVELYSSSDYSKAYNFALEFLSIAPRSIYQVTNFLENKKNFHLDIVNEVVASFLDSHLLDDNKFAADWVKNRLETKKFSIHKIRRELEVKGVSGDIIQIALEEITLDTETVVAKKLVEKKLATFGKLSYQVKARRLTSMLAYRGYSSEVVSRVIFEALQEEENF